jgi:hypothetical protein
VTLRNGRPSTAPSPEDGGGGFEGGAVVRPTGSRAVVLASLAVAVAAAPAMLWYGWAYAVSAPSGPSGPGEPGEPGEPPVFFSLRHSSANHAMPSPLLWDVGFYGQLLRDLATVVLTPVGLGLFIVGLAHRDARRHTAWLVASAVLVVVLPRKFHEMNYYFLVILPPLCAVAGLGWQLIQERFRPSRAVMAGGLAVLLLAAVRYSASASYIIPAEDRTVLAAARAVQPLVGADERVVTMHGSTLDLLYYCDRPGWAIAPDAEGLERRLAEYRGAGARVLVVAGVSWQTRDAGCRDVLASLEPIVTGDDYAVYRLPEVATPVSDAGDDPSARTSVSRADGFSRASDSLPLDR